MIDHICNPNVYNEMFLFLFGALVTLAITFFQWLFSRRQLWQGACESMLQDLRDLYLKTEALAQNPQPQNHISFQFAIDNCKHMIMVKGKRFVTKRACIQVVRNLVGEAYFEIVLNPENEKVINVSGPDSPQYQVLMMAVQRVVNQASEKLLDGDKS